MRLTCLMPLAVLLALPLGINLAEAASRTIVPSGPGDPPLPYVLRIATVPENPQPGPVSIVVDGWLPYDCGTTYDGTAHHGRPYTIGLTPNGPCGDTTWTHRFDLGSLAAGRYSFIISLAVVADPRGDTTGVQDTTFYSTRFEFTVGEPPPPQPALPYVNRIFTVPEQPNDAGPTTVVLLGDFPYPPSFCGEVFDANGITGHPYAVGIRPLPGCTGPAQWGWQFPLGQLAAGTHSIEVVLAVVDDPAADSLGGPDTTFYRGTFEFVVSHRDTLPPPPGTLPYVTTIDIVRKQNIWGPPHPICPGDSIAVLFHGLFPNTCYSVRAIEVLPAVYPTIGPFSPPVIWVQVDSLPCGRRACEPLSLVWNAAAFFGPLSAGSYDLPIQMSIGTCFDSVPPPPRYFTRVPFEVASSCSSGAESCLVGRFLRVPGEPLCDARIAAGQPAQVVFGVNSSMALAGLQGEFVMNPPGLRIVGIAPIGAAAGMRLSWTGTADGGARYILFAERGAPIPAAPWSWSEMPDPVSILQVTVEQPGSQATEVTYVTPTSLLGSDAEGHGVHECPIPPWLRLSIDFASARICSERVCDLNADGVLDVRDLVLMVNCLHGEGPCPDSSGVLGCVQDGSFTLDDVMCCARKVLGQDPCDGCPSDSNGVRRESSVALTIGQPVESGEGVDVPLRLSGADRIGAARVALAVPLERYELRSVDLLGSASSWLHLYEARNGRVVVGLVRIAPETTGEVDLMLRLALKPGQTTGGEVAAAEAEFSGPDGVKLDVDLGTPSQRLGGPARLVLSSNRPNPFTGETSFSITLDRPAHVEVGIYDVSGRRVCSIHDGPLAAGTSGLSWNGLRDDGSRAVDGIYFYRAIWADRAVSRKMILLQKK